jgi:tRNA-dihydrouridine synthase B
MNPLKIGKTEIPHPLILAPMCGITLKPFRKVCKELDAGLVFNQMVSAKALTMNDQKSQKIMEFDEAERPLGLQVFGNDPDVLGEAAKIMSEVKPDVIDLNLGCPAKKIVNDGGGSALMSDTKKLQKIFKNMRESIPGTFTVKMRAGWDEKSKNALDVARLAEDEGVDAVALHARTRTQAYTGSSDWAFIREMKSIIKTIPVIGNGDVKTGADARRMMNETGCDGVMTGRGAFENPWIFREFLQDGFSEIPTHEKRDMILKQYAYAIEYHGMKVAVKMMRKHLCAYTKGLRDGAKFRVRLLSLEDWDEIQDEVNQFFS